MKEPAWMEISMVVNGELAEAVADVLSRYIPDSVVIETTEIAYDPFTFNKPVGPLRVTGYLPVDEDYEATRQKIEEGLWYLGRIQPLPEVEFKEVEQVNWVETWKQHYHPIPMGERLLILPAWLENPDESRIPIKINPGMAFGTGTHPTTQLCLMMLEQWTPQGQPMIDVGCGSAILGIAGVKLGVSHALGVDVDEPSLPSARENLVLNGVETQVELGLGSVKEILAGQFSVQRAPLVVANILAPILVELLGGGMVELVSPGGHLMLSGILEAHLPMLDEALAKTPLKEVDRRQIADWVALVLEKPAEG